MHGGLEYRCQLSVENGDLDVVRLRVPKNWSGPFDVESAVPVSTEFTAADDQAWNAHDPFCYDAIAKGSNVYFRVRRTARACKRSGVASVPAISIESLSQSRRYLCVPDSIDSQPIVWTENGVRAATAPQKLLVGLTNNTPAHCVEIVKDPFQVAIQAQASPQPAPQIRLADTVVAAGELGGRLDSDPTDPRFAGPGGMHAPIAG